MAFDKLLPVTFGYHYMDGGAKKIKFITYDGIDQFQIDGILKKDIQMLGKMHFKVYKVIATQGLGDWEKIYTYGGRK